MGCVESPADVLFPDISSISESLLHSNYKRGLDCNRIY
jgi:hypothetical protein